MAEEPMDNEMPNEMPMERSFFKFSLLRIIIIIFAVGFIIGLVRGIMEPAAKTDQTDIGKAIPSDMKINMQPILKSNSADKIAVISMHGIIGEGYGNSTEEIIAKFRTATSDPSIKAVILKVENPGGSAHDSNIIWKEVKKYKDSGKPLVAFFYAVAASGGYYISAPADRIIATPETITGSIGVIWQYPNYFGLMNKLGLQMTTIKSGKQKDMLSPYKPPDPEDEKIIQSLISESYATFVDVISDGRKLDQGYVREIADGRIYSAKQALNNKLIDEIGYFEDAVKLARKLAKSESASPVDMEIKQSYPNLLMREFRMNHLMNFLNFLLSSGPYCIEPSLAYKYL